MMSGPFSTLPARRKTVQDLADARNKALALYAAAHGTLMVADAAIAEALAAHRGASNGETRYNHHLRAEKLHFHGRLDLTPRADYMAMATRLVDTDCWSYVIAITDLETMMDKTAKDALNQSLLDSPPEFTVENVLATLDQFLLDADTIWKRGIAVCFSKLDRRFRSHDGWKIGSRMILRHVFDDQGYWGYGGNHRDTFMDVERVFKLLDVEPGEQAGRKKVVNCDLTWALEQARGRQWGARQTAVETDYFRIRAWKNGNVHVWFKRDDLLDKVNQILGEYYGAPIPEDREPECDPLAEVKHTPAKRYGFFPTPPEAVKAAFGTLCCWGEKGETPMRILEPSAGTGNLANACLRRPTREWHAQPERYNVRPVVDCVEIQPALAEALRDTGAFGRVLTADFLQVQPATTGLYDEVVMNPPFDRERDIDHVMHALRFLKDGGRLRAIMSAGTEFRETKKSAAFRDLMNRMGAEWKDMPAGSFASVGTYCNTGVLTVTKGPADKVGSKYGRQAFRDPNEQHW